MFSSICSDASDPEHQSSVEVTTEEHVEDSLEVSQLNNQVCTPNEVKMQVSNAYDPRPHMEYFSSFLSARICAQKSVIHFALPSRNVIVANALLMESAGKRRTVINLQIKLFNLFQVLH